MAAWTATRTGVQLPSPPISSWKMGEKNRVSKSLGRVISIIIVVNASRFIPPFMNSRLLTKIAYHCALLLACLTLSARPQQPVLLTPGENDLVVLNGCVISACNYLAAVKAQHSLDKDFWAKILLVRYNDHPAGHAYCVWETDGAIYGYDRNAGALPIPDYTRDARSIAIVPPHERGKLHHTPLP